MAWAPDSAGRLKLGRALDMVKRYVALADVDLVARHAVASPADRLAGLGRR